MRKCCVFLCLWFLFSFAPQPATCSQEGLHKKAPFPVGVALDTDKLKYEEKYWTTALAHFNSFTPERVMKPAYLQPKQGKFNFTEIDHLMAFCKEQKVRLHGHTLVWHKAQPVWMERYNGSPEQWEDLLRGHIQTVVKHCRQQVRSWDVVNEAFNDDGSFRNTIWYKHIGPSYIEKAYQFAKEADSSALLFYNDYSLEVPGAKLQAVVAYFNAARSKGIKIDGIGLQMHVTLNYPERAKLNAVFNELEKQGYKVHLSELDVRLNGEETLFAGGKKLQELQKQRVKEIVGDYMKLNSSNRFGITLWGVSDNDSWLSEDHIRAKPMLFDSRYKAKPAFCGFLEGLDQGH